MNHLNSILIEGIVTHDPELVYSSKEGETKKAKFSIANDRFYTDKNGEKKQETTFIAVTAWNKLGEKCMSYLKQGLTVRVVGRLKLTKWETKENESRSSYEIIAEHIEYRPKAKDGIEAKASAVKDNLIILEEDDEKIESKKSVLYSI